MTAPAVLPFDVLGNVLHKISQSGDSTSMNHCRLANKVLANMARKHTFHTVRLRQRPADDDNSHPIGRFADLVRENPAIAACVGVMEIVSTKDYNEPGPFEVLHQVKNLESFSIAFGHEESRYNRSWNNIEPGIRSSIEALLRSNSLTSLAMTGIHRIPIDLFQHQPLLRDLDLLEVTPSLEEMATSELPSLRLLALHLREGSLKFWKYVGGGDCLFNISEATELEVSGYEATTAELQQCITDMIAVPGQLESLKISAIVFADSDLPWTSCSSILGSLLPASTRTLRKISLSIQTVMAPDWNPYVDLLSELARIQGSNVLEDIHLCVQSGWDSSLNKDPALWRGLDNVLSSGFPHMRRLILEYDVSNEGEDALVRELLAAQLPWCHANLDFTSQVEEVLL